MDKILCSTSLEGQFYPHLSMTVQRQKELASHVILLLRRHLPKNENKFSTTQHSDIVRGIS